MESKNKYLTEENYEKGKKNLKKIILIILIGGLLIGGGLIIGGIVSIATSGSSNETEMSNKEAQIDAINQELASLEAQKTQEFMSNGFSEKYYQLESEIENKTSEKNELTLKNFGSASKGFLKKGVGGVLIIIGIDVIGVTLLICLVLFIIYKRREITAFTAQQSIPVTKEVIGEMAPTVGSAAGTIGKEIAKGITEGIKEGSNSEEK